MPAMTPASSRWLDAFPRSALLFFLVSVAMACGTAEPPRAAVSEAPPAADPAAQARPAATNAAKDDSTTPLPAQAETRSPRTNPPANGEIGQPRVITWGSGPDSFGDTPDKDGYYSSRRHFDLASKDKVRRALVLLEEDPDSTLHLRLSRNDIDSMPDLEEVLEKVSLPGAPDRDQGLLDPFRPGFQLTASGASVPGADASIWSIATPEPGLELRVEVSELDQGATLRSRESGSASDLWAARVTWEADFYLEFSSDLPRRFVLFDTYSGGAVYDLRGGLRCNLKGPSGGDKGNFGRWPTFADSGRALVLLHKEVLWRIDLESCAWTEIGRLPYPPKRDLVDALLVRALASPTGATFHALFGETSRKPTSPHGIRPAQAQFVLLGNENGRLVERRRVFGRLYNAMNGLEGAASDTTRTPFLLITQFRSLSPVANSVALQRNAFTSDICFLLIESEQGHFFALRTPGQTGAGLRLDRNRGLVWYDGTWWNLHALAAWSGDDLARAEKSQ